MSASIATAKNGAALAAVSLSALMLGLEISSIPAILPTLERVLPADFRQLQWIVNAYTIAMTTCLMAMGALADRLGRKRVFMAGVLAFGLASLACGLATQAPVLIAARFVQGASAAAMLACQIAILSNPFRDGAERGSAFGWWGVVFGFGLGFGPLIGGLTVAVASWEWVFLVHVGLAAVTWAAAKAGITESFDTQAVRFDWPGVATLSFSVFALVYLITQGEAPVPANPAALALALAGLASVLAFLLVETRTPRPMFDFGAFRNRAFSGALLGAAGMNFSFWPFVIYLPIYVQAVQNLDSVRMGLALLAYTLPTLLVPPLAERLLLARGPRFVIPLGLLTIGLGFVLMRLGAGVGEAAWVTLLPGCVVTGLGVGLTNTPVANTATGSVAIERAGMASAMDMSVRMIALSISIALMGLILVRGIRASLEPVAPHAASGLTALSESVAAGNLAAAEAAGIPIELARHALGERFDAVMLYGATAAFGFGCLSLLTLKGGARMPALR